MGFQQDSPNPDSDLLTECTLLSPDSDSLCIQIRIL